MKLSVVIPSYADPTGLWFTVAAARVDLEADFQPDEYEIIAVIDGPEDEETRVIHGMRQQGTCKLLSTDTRTPQLNRHIGLLQTQAPYVFFFDSHVVPSRHFFRRMLETAGQTGAAIVHSPHCFWRKHDKGLAYGYYVEWSQHFWASAAEDVPKFSDRPYRICLAGHGAIVVDKRQYLDAGGYWDALRGWGGEEPQLNLKMWMLGREIYIEPRCYHWHYMPNKRHMSEIMLSERFVRNFLLVSYASGGQKYLDATYHFFTQCNNGHETLEDALQARPIVPYRKLYESIPLEAAEERRAICAGPYGGDLDALREFFRGEGIPH